ncbi:type I restriction endonuclease subunit M [Delftia acidovorans]|uniref:Type I restriction endonuclease subunit M n=1 Tax=Delftia acidovorans TaxID=80866 RepID=A0AAJ2VBI6_DELAC|nr:type I restriction endonuclease subunit M [Delftia acidovorans]MDX4954711.1 type I restriction endonuclease subunit M [Delftia acidovorans]MDX4957360.1 type I restriction endonuclease subunit M [Delftia acidovorans]
MEIDDLVRPAATIPQTTPFFHAGRWVTTLGVDDLICKGEVDPHELLRRHQSGDWGEIHTLDRALNQHSLVDRAMVMSVYKVGTHTIWVITDAGWQTTTLLLPYER